MKKYLSIMLAFILLIIVSACGDEAIDKKDQTAVDLPAIEENHEDEDTSHADGSHEPDEGDMCAFCNMKVYPEADPMGVFTAQAKTADGEYVFFDDSGCLLNSPRRDGTEYEEKWVRDYVTSEWINADQAIPVKADIKTPMKYGYAFFMDKKSAEKFIVENADKHAELASWEQIDQISNERYMKKMKMQEGSDSGSMNKENDDTMDGGDNEESGH